MVDNSISNPMDPTPNLKTLKAIGTALESDKSPEWIWLKGDGSDRRYARVLLEGKSAIAMVLSHKSQLELLNQKYDWLPIRKTLLKANIPCPKVYSTIENLGTILIEDLGDTDLYSLKPHTHNPTFKNHFNQCCDIIRRLQCIPISKESIWAQREFDYKKLQFELLFFYEHLLKKALKLEFNHTIKNRIVQEIETLAIDISKQPQCFVHRDFHSKNILIHQQKSVIIDFQDACLGPYAYDPVSLCFDSYLTLPNQTRLELMDSCFKIIKPTTSNEAMDAMQNQWPLVLLQRQLKAMGSFAFLTKTKKKNYLEHLPNALQSLNLKEIRDLKQFPYLTEVIPELIRRKMDQLNAFF